MSEIGAILEQLPRAIADGIANAQYHDRSELPRLAKRKITDRHLAKHEPHTSPQLEAMASLQNGQWDELNDGDLTLITSIRCCYNCGSMYVPDDGAVEHMDCQRISATWDHEYRGKGYKADWSTENSMSLYGLLEYVSTIEDARGNRIPGSLRRAETRSIRNASGEAVNGRPQPEEEFTAFGLRRLDSTGMFRRLVLRGVTAVGGRRYTIDPAYPTSREINCKRRIRVQHEGAGKPRDEWTGKFEFFLPGQYTWGKVDAPGKWVAIAEQPVQHHLKNGSSYGQEDKKSLNQRATKPPTPHGQDEFHGA